MAERISKDDFQSRVIDFSGLSVVEFYTDSCVPCKRMSPVLSALDEEYVGEVYIAKVNAVFDGELAEKYDVNGTPTFLFFKNGEVVERLTGAKKKEELQRIIEANK